MFNWYDWAANVLLVAMYGYIAVKLIQRLMEAKGMKYSVTELPNGRIFSFSLGVYAGCVQVVRDPDCRHPRFIRHVNGWEVRFPMMYTDEMMDCFLMYHNPPYGTNTSHTRDMDIYREVVIRKNDHLSCVAGDIYCALK